MKDSKFYWPNLLYRQLLLLSCFTGIFSLRYFAASCIVLCFILVVQLTRQRYLSQLLLLVCGFGAGFYYAKCQEPVFSPDPAWMQVKKGNIKEYQNKLVRIRAKVDEVSGQPDRRLRIILSQVCILEPDITDSQAILPGRLVFTWSEPVTIEGSRAGDYSPHLKDSKAPVLNKVSRPVAGQSIELSIKIRKVRGFSNPGLWEIEQYWKDQGVSYRGWGVSDKPDLVLGSGGSQLEHWREYLRQRILTALPKAEGSLLPGTEFIPALLLGDRFLLNSKEMELFAKSTLTHSLALSGLHLSYAAALGYACISLLYKIFPSLASLMPRRKAAALAAIVPAMLYLWLGGAPPSLLRSALMLMFWCILFYLQKPGVLLDGLLWALGVILLFSPLTLFDLRLQLSAIAIAAIVLAAPFLQAGCSGIYLRSSGKYPGYARRMLGKAGAGLFMILSTSLAVQLVMLPLLLRTFGFTGLVFPLNALWLPVLGAIVMPFSFLGLGALSLGLDSLATGCFYLASQPCTWLLQLLQTMESHSLLPVALFFRPHWLTILGFWTILALLPALIMEKERRINRIKFLLAIISVFICLFPAALSIYDHRRDIVRLRLLDVGHGQAVLIEWKGGKRLLFDGGGNISPRFDIGKEIITATLADNRFPELDFMLNSHPDTDHLQGLIYPLAHAQVSYYADNGMDSTNTVQDKILQLLKSKGMNRNILAAGDRLTLGPELELEILHPKAGQIFSSNNSSLSGRLVWRGKPLVLICGDLERTGQRSLLKSIYSNAVKSERIYPHPALQAEVLIVPHHGSGGAMLTEFYQAVSPSLALVSCAFDNHWSLPSKQVCETLGSLGINRLDTSEYGQIILEWEGPDAAIQIRTSRSGRLLAR